VCGFFPLVSIRVNTRKSSASSEGPAAVDKRRMWM
jgi:hypothetical protein